MRWLAVPVAVGLLAVGPQGVAAQVEPDACSVAPLDASELAAGAAAVRRYRAGRERQFAPDLMGYRDGPALGPPSRRERRRIRASIGFRRLFALNTNRLLIRRLLRDHRRANYDFGVPLAPLEIRSMRFRDKVGSGMGRVEEYLERCARGVSGGVYLADRVPEGAAVIVNLTGERDRHEQALRMRYRYADLLESRLVRYTLQYLEDLQEQISDDWDELERRGVDLTSLSTSTENNRVEVTLRNPSRRAAAILAERYGEAVWMDPEPTIVCTLVGCGSGVVVTLTRLPQEAHTAQVCALGRCSSLRISQRHRGQNVLFAEVRCRRPRHKLLHLTVTVFARSGARLRFSSARVRLTNKHQPNGPDCGPTCWNAGLRYRGDTGTFVKVRRRR